MVMAVATAATTMAVMMTCCTTAMTQWQINDSKANRQDAVATATMHTGVMGTAATIQLQRNDGEATDISQWQQTGRLV